MSNFLLTAGDTPIVHIHIPKTGGSSIRGGVGNTNGEREGVFGFKNYEGPVYGEIPAAWEKYWKFAFIRHPMMRWWSAYRDWKHLRGFSGTPDDFAVETLAQRNPAQWNSIAHHTQPQTHPSLCLSHADTVFRYTPRTYEDDVAVVCEKAGLPKHLKVPRLRETPVSREASLSAAMHRMLLKFYENDIKELGYESS